MTERENVTNLEGADLQRSAEEIRQDITTARETIADTVEEINVRIQEKLEWRGYIKRYPYVALGAAAGLGVLASGLFKRERPPLERIMGTVSETIRDSLGRAISRAGGQGLIRLALFGIATQVAATVIQDSITAALRNDGSTNHSQGAVGSADKPEANPARKSHNKNRSSDPIAGGNNGQ